MDTYLWPNLCSNINDTGINSMKIFLSVNKDGKTNTSIKAKADINQKCYSIYAAKKSRFILADHQEADFQRPLCST